MTAKKTPKKTVPQTRAYTAPARPTYAPVSDEVTPYGATKFRTPWKANEYVGTKGSPILAGILDIDGTMQTFGHGLDKTLATWCEKLQKAHPDMVWIVITARDHEFMYDTSFNWIMRAFPYPFIGPFCRAENDPRYASEFKRELAQGFEDMGLYKIIAAADDNKFVNAMWKHWATTHFTDPAEFDLLECHSRTDYLGWRGGLPSKYTSSSTGYGQYGSTSDAHKGEHWVTGGWTDGGAWATGHWAKNTPVAPATHRPAGQSRYPDGQFGTKDLTETAAWAKYLAARYPATPKPNKADSWPRGAINQVCISPNVADRMEEVIAALGSPTSLTRPDLEDIVAHAHPSWTPVTIADMSMADLRVEAGLSDTSYRELLYDEIAGVYGNHMCDEELDDLTLEEVEAMMEMSRSEIDTYLNTVSPRPRAEERPVTMSDEEFAKRKARIDLEDLVLNLRSDLSLPQVEAKDSRDLEAIVAAVEIEAAALNADEAQAIEVVA